MINQGECRSSTTATTLDDSTRKESSLQTMFSLRNTPGQHEAYPWQASDDQKPVGDGRDEALANTMQRSPYGSVRRLRVHRQGDTIVVQGHVDVFFHRQIALATVMREFPTLGILDQIQVG